MRPETECGLGMCRSAVRLTDIIYQVLNVSLGITDTVGRSFIWNGFIPAQHR